MQYEGSFAESMLGHKVQSSPYRVNVLSDVVCQKVRQMTTVKMNACHCMPDLNHFLLTLSLSSQEIKLCQVKLDTEQASRLQRHIDSGYHQNWILDGLPSASVISHDFLGKDITSSTYVGGFPIGFQDPVNENEYYVYNHLDIRVGYHEKENGYHIVQFAVQPMSVHHLFQNNYQWDGVSKEGFDNILLTCDTNRLAHLSKKDIAQYQSIRSGDGILYTYDVRWIPMDVTYSNRWETYITNDFMVPMKVHWNSVFNSVIMTILCIAGGSFFLKRHLQQTKKQDELRGLISGDLYRTPTVAPMIFAVLVGTGVQLGSALTLVVLAACAGVVDPAERGSMLSAFLFVGAICGLLGGYITSRLGGSFQGHSHDGSRDFRSSIWTGVLVPGVVVMFPYCIINTLLSLLGSTSRAPFTNTVASLGLVTGVNLPAVVVGEMIACKSMGNSGDDCFFPHKLSNRGPNELARTSLTTTCIHIALAGILPFIFSYMELFFVMSSLWMGQYYYSFLPALAVLLLQATVCSQTTILLVFRFSHWNRHIQ